MEEGAIRTEPGKVVPLRVAAQPTPPLELLVEQAFRIAIGLGAIASDVLAEAVARTLGRESVADEPLPTDEASGPASGLPLVAGAAIGIALEAGRRSARAATTLFRSGELFLSFVTSPGFVRQPLQRTGSRLGALDAKWREQRPRDEEAASAFMRLLIPQLVDAALDQVDLNELVRARVDLDRIVEEVDLDRAVSRLDIDAIVNRLDIEAIVNRLDLDAIADRLDVDRVIVRADLRTLVERVPLEDILERIDVDQVVARVDLGRVVERIDVDAVAAKLDVEAVARRLDLVALAREVIDEIDLPEIIRDAMGSMTTETVGGIRVQSMTADRAISRLVDRVLQRRADRDGGQRAGSSDEGPD